MLQKEAINQLNSLNVILNQVREDDYTLSLTSLQNSSIGKHVRHIIEFYQSLLFNKNNGIIDYDDRKRSLILETNVKFANDSILEIVDQIDRLESDRAVHLSVAYGNLTEKYPTSLYRELAYNIEHTVHHLAIIKIAVSLHFNYIETGNHFGYASSTIKYIESQ